MPKLTLGTARLTEARDCFVVEYMTSGSFLVGEQTFGNINAALRFCRLRDLRVLS